MEKYIKKLLGFFKFEIGPITVHNFNNFGKLSNNLLIRELTNSYMVQLLCESTFNVLLNVAIAPNYLPAYQRTANWIWQNINWSIMF